MHLSTDPETPLSGDPIPPRHHAPAPPPHPPRAQRERKGNEHLYFAYGSNLSPTQMHHRCTTNPTMSAKPLAIAVLPRWRWFICEAGYANVIPPMEMRVEAQKGAHPTLNTNDSITLEHENGNGHGNGVGHEDEDVVYGVLYRMDPADEGILDGYEGIDHSAEKAYPPPSSSSSITLQDGNGNGNADGEGNTSVSSTIRPHSQGEGDYNKWYLHAPIVQWLDGSEAEQKKQASLSSSSNSASVPVLVYVDEERVQLGPPRTEYISRMNRAIREAIGLGVPAQWLSTVMRKFIPSEST